jgi:hypothetical protein
VWIAALLGLAGCGGGGSSAAHRATRPPMTVDRSAQVIYFYRVQGDDPLPDSATLYTDGRLLVIRGGGHGGSRFDDVVLKAGEARRALRLARTAPLRILADNTITPGGFSGSDNAMRYLIRRGHFSVGVEDGHIPRAIRPLVHEMNAIIENDKGRIVQSQMHTGVGAGS